MNQEEFERLKPEEQERVFHQIPFRERGELFLHAHNPTQLIQSLSQEELYLLTREMDLEERSEVLRHANLPQLFFISDMDCWKKDRLQPGRFVKWLETLMDADEKRLLAWLVEMDYETVVSGFSRIMCVIKPEWEYPSDELLGDRPFFTLDERYFISVTEENIETVRRAIEILFENHRGRYAALLEGILAELDYEVEEEAFQKRSLRLSERGFPDSETAHHIYRPLTRREFERFPLKDASKKETRAPAYLSLWSKNRLFLDEVLLLLREESLETRERIEEELAWLSNKVIASEGIDFASEERVREGIDRARNLTSLGLELLSGGDLDQARQILKERWLEIIFRWGVSELARLREAAQKMVELYWKSNIKFLLEFLDSPYEFIFQGLFQALPQCYDAQVKDKISPLRQFRDRQDLERTQRSLAQIERIHEFLAAHFPNLFPRLQVEMSRDESESKLFSLLGTVFAHFSLNEKISTAPLSSKEMSRFLRHAKRDKEKFLGHFFAKEQELLRPLWALVFQAIEEELGALDPSRPVDPRFVSSLRLSAPSISKI